MRDLSNIPPQNVQRLIPVENAESSRLGISLAILAGRGADTAEIVDAMVLTWQQVDAALSPIIGQGGVAALYKRSLYLTAQAHPWLAGVRDGVQNTTDLVALKSVFEQQSRATAAAGGGALLKTFYELLAGLVGPSLTEQLLQSVWANNSPHAQDKSP